MENSTYTYNNVVYDRIVFDVGANNGSSTIHLAENNANIIVFGFEPTPEMCDIIKSKTELLNNYILIEKAVSDYNGKSVFNVAGNWDWGCSSLLEFSDKSKTNWPGRTDFNVTTKLEVDVIRLDTFIEEYKIPKIDFLHIDTQGSDLKVLNGVGMYIEKVVSGEMECGSDDDILYIGQNKLNESVKFLLLNGFCITDVFKNDIFCNEVNVKFERK